MTWSVRWRDVRLALALLFPLGFGCRDVLKPVPQERTGGSTATEQASGPSLLRGELWPRLVLDEVLPGNASVVQDEAGELDDFVELFNPGGDPVDLGGWALGDDPAPEWTFPTGTSIGPGARLLVWADQQPEQGPLHADLGLSKDGEGLWLYAPDGTLVDTISWPALPDDVVWGRFPSGSDQQAASIFATPGRQNPDAPGDSLDPTDLLYPEHGVVRIDLTLSSDALDALAADPNAWVEGGLGFGDVWLSPVGVTLKGGIGSFRPIDEKAAFRVDVDHFVDGWRLRGLEHLTLNNMVQDPTKLHELLSYTLFRDHGVPAPRTAHVELYLNGAYRGLYLNVESPDHHFLERWFEHAAGNLYEGSYGMDIRHQDVPDFELDVQGDDDVTDRSDLDALATFLATPPTEDAMPELEQRFDLDEVLDAMAGEAMLGHWDGYTFNRNNYRLYHDPVEDRWSLLPWGTDQTFRRATDPWDPKGIVGRFCLAIPSCEQRYDDALLRMAEGVTALDCEGVADEMSPVLVPLWESDPMRTTSMRFSQSRTLQMEDFCDTWPGAVEGALP